MHFRKMDNRYWLKLSLYLFVLLFTGFGFVSSMNELNDFTTTKQSNELFAVKEEFTFSDLQEYNAILINRLENFVLFVATLILFISDVALKGGNLKNE